MPPAPWPCHAQGHLAPCSSSATAASALVEDPTLRNKGLTALLSICFLSNAIFPFRSSSPSNYLIACFYHVEHLQTLALAPALQLRSAPKLPFSDPE